MPLTSNFLPRKCSHCGQCAPTSKSCLPLSIEMIILGRDKTWTRNPYTRPSSYFALFYSFSYQLFCWGIKVRGSIDLGSCFVLPQLFLLVVFWTILKYHSLHYCQIPLQLIPLIPLKQSCSEYFLSVLRDGFMASVTWRPRLMQIS